MNNILQKIMAVKRQEIEAAKKRLPVKMLREQIVDAPPARDFVAAISTDAAVSLIAEVKRASPSKGMIRSDFDPVDIATQYVAAGANCISVLTDEEFFGGRLDFMTRVRAAIDVPLLRKDFIVDEYQIFESRAAGADAVLLIAECLDSSQLAGFLDQIHGLGMAALVEFHDIANLDRVVECGARLIGINNRNLDTFETDLQHCLRLRSRIPGNRLVVAESGIQSKADVDALAAAEIDAMLVGEWLMRSRDIPAAVRLLLGD